MKRLFLPIIAASFLLAACGDATTEKVSHRTTEADGQPESTGTATGMADTLSTNATLPGSDAPTGGTGD